MMRTFDHFPEDILCPICGTSEGKECFLMPIDGTDDNGICEAAPVHVSCLEDNAERFRYNNKAGVIYMRVEVRV